MSRLLIAVAVLYGLVFAVTTRAQPAPADGPRYGNGADLILPSDYREWTFLSAGLGMTYDAPTAAQQATPSFLNVFVNPSSYRSFLRTGMFPDKTMFVLEIRKSATAEHILKGGRFQSDVAGIEAEVKDARFPDGWAFFQFGPAGALKDATAPLSGNAAAPCVECHTKNTAVERTFAQFYPTLLAVAREKRTIKPGF